MMAELSFFSFLTCTHTLLLQDSSEDSGSSEGSGDSASEVSLSGVGDGFPDAAEHGIPQLTLLTDAAEAIPDLEVVPLGPDIMAHESLPSTVCYYARNVYISIFCGVLPPHSILLLGGAR